MDLGRARGPVKAWCDWMGGMGRCPPSSSPTPAPLQADSFRKSPFVSDIDWLTTDSATNFSALDLIHRPKKSISEPSLSVLGDQGDTFLLWTHTIMEVNWTLSTQSPSFSRWGNHCPRGGGPAPRPHDSTSNLPSLCPGLILAHHTTPDDDGKAANGFYLLGTLQKTKKAQPQSAPGGFSWGRYTHTCTGDLSVPSLPFPLECKTANIKDIILKT